jgi:translation initiation factor IF-2
MTSSGKVRIYELSKDLGLENKDVLDAAEKLSIAAKSHSSSISDSEAGKIRSLLGKGLHPVNQPLQRPNPHQRNLQRANRSCRSKRPLPRQA